MVCAMVRPRYSVRAGGGSAGEGTAVGAGACPNEKAVMPTSVARTTAKFGESFERGDMRMIEFINAFPSMLLTGSVRRKECERSFHQLSNHHAWLIIKRTLRAR